MNSVLMFFQLIWPLSQELCHTTLAFIHSAFIGVKKRYTLWFTKCTFFFFRSALIKVGHASPLLRINEEKLVLICRSIKGVFFLENVYFQFPVGFWAYNIGMLMFGPLCIFHFSFIYRHLALLPLHLKWQLSCITDIYFSETCQNISSVVMYQPVIFHSSHRFIIFPVLPSSGSTRTSQKLNQVSCESHFLLLKYRKYFTML